MALTLRAATRRRPVAPGAARAGWAEVADTAQRLAVLLGAGLAPAAAWRFACAQASAGPRARIAARLARGSTVGAALGREDARWRALGAAWGVATTAGSPLAETLRGFAAALRDAAATIDDIEVALAEPAGTSRLMTWLPVVGVGLGAALGVDTLVLMTTDPRGIACIVVGATLMLGARLWARALVRSARPEDEVPGLDAELLAVALSGGLSIPRAQEVVREALIDGRVGRPGAADGAYMVDEAIEDILALSRDAGVPAVDLLRAGAEDARRRARTRGRARAARLATRLLLPLGACTLPAFLIVGVLPLLISILDTTGLDLP